MVLYKKPKYIWEKYYLTALDFFKALDDKEKERINKIEFLNPKGEWNLVDYESIYSEIMKAANQLKNGENFEEFEKLHKENWYHFVDYKPLMEGEIPEIDSDLMSWLIISLKGTYDYQWVFGDYAEYDRYTGARLKNLYKESDGWYVRLMKEGEFN